jgi:hypothetical protein
MAITDRLTIPGIPKVIDPARHAVLDYGVATTYFTLGARFLRHNRAAAALAFINGGMVLGMSLFTDYPGGLFRKISFKTHGALDVAQAALAGFGPVLFGFAGEQEARPFYGQALNELGVIAATDWNAAATA